MSQRTTLRQLDAEAFAAFAGAGMGDSGTYRSPDGDTVAITYLYDDQPLIESGEAGTRLAGRSREITLLLQEFEDAGLEPAQGGLVIGDDGRRWRLGPMVDADDSAVRFAVSLALGDGE